MRSTMGSGVHKSIQSRGKHKVQATRLMGLAPVRLAKRPFEGRAWVLLSGGAVACALGAGIAQAQNALTPGESLPAITPGGAPVSAVQPGLPAPNRRAPVEEARISLRFQDASVADLVQMISQQGNVEIIINGDVAGTIKYINLEDKTPEDALKAVAVSAGLQWRRLDARTFLIAKELPAIPEVPAQLPSAPEIPTYNGLGGAAVLPMPSLDGIPELVNPDIDANGNERRESRVLAVKNVPVRIMAWWIDKQNQPEPIQYSTSRQNTERFFDKHLGEPAFAPEVTAAMNGGYAPPTQYPNPYAPSGPYGAGGNGANEGGLGQFSSPYTQDNAQFGFGGNNNTGGGRRGNRGGRGNNGGGRGNNRGGLGGGGGDGLFDLSEQGVDQIIAIDPQNALLVYGTEAGVRALENIVQFLDKPLRQVEIEAQFVSVNSNNTDEFGINFTSQNGPFTVAATPASTINARGGTFSLGFVRNNFQATLNSLVSRGRAKVVTAPRVTAINNLTASLQSSTSTPIVTTSTQAGIGGQVGQQQNVNFITTSIGLTVTPTINNDDTITVVMQPQVSTQQAIPGSIAPRIVQQIVQTVANVKDGDTIVLGGLRDKQIARTSSGVPLLSQIPLLGALFRSRSDIMADNDLIVFLTARIKRRLDEDAPVPGT
jgi:type II secretory pathway component GspD/PulD (secretin)